MLTKEEREEIAERAKESSEVNGTLYEVLFRYPASLDAPFEDEKKEILSRIIDLCDTSNMIELPLDKDGEAIRVDDNVYDIDGTELAVESLRYCTEYGCVVICRTSNDTLCTYSGNELTHKSPVTTKLLAQRIKHVLENEATSIGVNPYVELGRIAEQLESLGDSNAN